MLPAVHIKGLREVAPSINKKRKRQKATTESSKALVQKASFAAEPTDSEDGVDLTLIRLMVSLSAAERLDVLR